MDIGAANDIHYPESNEVRLWLSVIAYNLGNLWRRLVPPKRIDTWSLTSLQRRLMKTGGRLIKHARYYWLLLAERHLTRSLFGAMLRRLVALSVPAGSRSYSYSQIGKGGRGRSGVWEIGCKSGRSIFLGVLGRARTGSSGGRRARSG